MNYNLLFPGDILPDGSIVVFKQKNHLLLASSSEFEHKLTWNSKEKCLYDRAQWFIPTPDELALAFSDPSVRIHFREDFYWSSLESIFEAAIFVYMKYGISGGCYGCDLKEKNFFVRPFKKIYYEPHLNTNCLGDKYGNDFVVNHLGNQITIISEPKKHEFVTWYDAITNNSEYYLPSMSELYLAFSNKDIREYYFDLIGLECGSKDKLHNAVRFWTSDVFDNTRAYTIAISKTSQWGIGVFNKTDNANFVLFTKIKL